MADVFVSYARSDRARVAPLIAAIEAQGWSVWWDPDIAPGQEFDQQIAAQLKAAAAVLVAWTPNSVGSRWVRGEARDGADRGILVPVRFDGAELPIDVRAIHTTDLDELSLDEHGPKVQEVLRALGAIIARERASRPVATYVESANPAAAGDAGRIAICVLPFANLSGDPGQEYFSDGLTEDIITELSRWRLLSVRSRSASFRYRGVAVDMKQVARDLNVRFIVEGSVRRMGERIRTSVQLIDAETGSHVWAEKFDRGLDEIFAVQDRVVQTIVSTLVGRVQVSDTERVRRKPPASMAAYEYVLKGNALSWDDPAEAAEAARLFEKAIEHDPDYAVAHALLAALCCRRWHEDPSNSDAALEEAYRLAKRGVELGDGESTCHAILGQVCLLRGSFDLAVQYARRAVDINPSNQWNAADLGSILIYVGQSEEALTWFARVREIDPYFDQPWYWRSVGQAYMALGRFQEALAMLIHARVGRYRNAVLMAACHAQLGDMDSARASVADCLAMEPDFSVAQFMRKEPFRIPADAERLAAALRLAGLPDGPSAARIDAAQGRGRNTPGTHSTSDAAEPAWIGEVLHFWFDELGEAHWFAKSGDVDARIHDRFLALHESMVAHDGTAITTPRSLLAAVVVLDQFSRNLFRGTARAFAADALARRIARSAIELGFDDAMTEPERMFLYLPFEHSEDRADQARSVELFVRLGNEDWTRYAIAHKVIIDRFGRFPHRNAVLDRVSSADELALLQRPMGSF